MDVKSMHWQFKQLYNKLDSFDKRDLTPAEIDNFLNQSQTVVTNFNYSNFEKSQFVRDVMNVLVKASIISSFSNSTYDTGKVITLPENYRHYLRGFVKESNCETPLELKIVELDDFDQYYKNSYSKPSSKWKRALACFRDNKIYIYTEGTLQNFTIDYLKKPNNICLGGYNDIDGTLTVASDCEYPDYIHDLIVDTAVFIATGAIENRDGLQIITNKINNYYASYFSSNSRKDSGS